MEKAAESFNLENLESEIETALQVLDLPREDLKIKKNGGRIKIMFEIEENKKAIEEVVSKILVQKKERFILKYLGFGENMFEFFCFQIQILEEAKPEIKRSFWRNLLRRLF